MATQSLDTGPAWARRWLIAAGIYNLLWGGLVVALPDLLFDFAGMEPPRYPQLWQCIGMIVGVYGIGYLVAARASRRHWPIVLVGFLGKVFGPIGFVGALVTGDLPLAFGATILTNDLIWWIPFAMILWDAARAHGGYAEQGAVKLADALDAVTDQHGTSLREITDARPALVVLTRHAGCTFCKEAIADLVRQRAAIDDAGLGIVVVSMSDVATLAEEAQRTGLTDASWISDPQRFTYRALEVGRGNFLQLFGPLVWWRGFVATLRGHLPGTLQGDGFQMPGAFVLHDGAVLKAHRHRTAADRLDHAAFACSLPS